MSKKSLVYICQQCSYQVAKWMGKCPECNQWNSFIEEIQGSGNSGQRKTLSHKESRPINKISEELLERIPTKLFEFDRVLGGGLVPGSLVLVGGEPGIGKSTLLLQVTAKLSLSYGKVLYVSGEESCSQLATRAKRLGVNESDFYILHETCWQSILEEIKRVRPVVFILDSIQTVSSLDLNSTPGTVSQIREVVYELMNYSKENNLTSFVIGHVTKEGAIAGPKVLEHMVDTVIYFEGDNLGQYRILRSVKNRFGSTSEVGIFEMTDKGLSEVKNPSQFFLEGPLEGSYGRTLTCIIEGSRSLFIEIQALVVENKYSVGRRTTHGLDLNRLAMLIAIIEKYFEIPLSFNDIYINVVGGFKLEGRESDLAIVAAILSSLKKIPVLENTIFFGEVGLTGEVRGTPLVEMKLKEASQLNYKKVITDERSARDYKSKFGLEIVGISKAEQILGVIF